MALFVIGTGYNIEDMRGKFSKFIEKNADSDIDAINTRLADLVSIMNSYRCTL